MKVPSGHQMVMPYLMLKDASKFIPFTETVFGAQVNPGTLRTRDDGKLMHAEVMIGGCTIMFSDSSEQWPEQTANLFIYVDNADQAFKKAIDAGSTVVMELSDQDYGRTCGVSDPFGNVWWITAVKV